MEQPTIREAVAVFDNAEKLESAVSELQSHGVDRSELSFLAHAALTGRAPGNLREAAGDPTPPREPVVSDTDLRQGRVLGTGLTATVAPFGDAGVTVAKAGAGAGSERGSRPAPGGERGRSREYTIRAQTKERLNKGLEHGRGVWRFAHRPLYGTIGACWGRIGHRHGLSAWLGTHYAPWQRN